MSKSSSNNLPLGTTPSYARMHKWLQRGLFVCLTALVLEGAFTMPLPGDLVRLADVVAPGDLQRAAEDPVLRRLARVHLSVPALRAGRGGGPEDGAGRLGRPAQTAVEANRVPRPHHEP